MGPFRLDTGPAVRRRRSFPGLRLASQNGADGDGSDNDDNDDDDNNDDGDSNTPASPGHQPDDTDPAASGRAGPENGTDCEPNTPDRANGLPSGSKPAPRSSTPAIRSKTSASSTAGPTSTARNLTVLSHSQLQRQAPYIGPDRPTLLRSASAWKQARKTTTGMSLPGRPLGHDRAHSTSTLPALATGPTSRPTLVRLTSSATTSPTRMFPPVRPDQYQVSSDAFDDVALPVQPDPTSPTSWMEHAGLALVAEAGLSSGQSWLANRTSSSAVALDRMASSSDLMARSAGLVGSAARTYHRRVPVGRAGAQATSRSTSRLVRPQLRSRPASQCGSGQVSPSTATVAVTASTGTAARDGRSVDQSLSVVVPQFVNLSDRDLRDLHLLGLRQQARQTTTGTLSASSLSPVDFHDHHNQFQHPQLAFSPVRLMADREIERLARQQRHSFVGALMDRLVGLSADPPADSDEDRYLTDSDDNLHSDPSTSINLQPSSTFANLNYSDPANPATKMLTSSRIAAAVCNAAWEASTLRPPTEDTDAVALDPAPVDMSALATVLAGGFPHDVVDSRRDQEGGWRDLVWLLGLAGRLLL